MGLQFADAESRLHGSDCELTLCPVVVWLADNVAEMRADLPAHKG